MCDFFEDDDFMDDDSFEDSLDEGSEMVDPSNGDSDLDCESDKGDDLTVDPFFIGGAMGFAYEAGVEERRRKRLLKEQSKRRKRKKFSDDSE